jgi:MFS family permease
MILLCVAFGAFAGDFGSGSGIPAVLTQGEEWHLAPVIVNRATNVSIIMCGVSGLVWMPLFNFWGRIPVLFWSSLLGLLFTLGCVLAPNFEAFYGLRALQGLTQSVGQTIGLAFIKDMFFFHEHARKIGIWYSIFIISPVFGPLCGNFIVGGLHRWQPIFWLVFAWSSFLLCMIICFGDESYYNRTVSQDQQPRRSAGQSGRLLRVFGLWQARTHHHPYYPKLGRCYGRLLEVFLKPIIPMSMFFYAITFMWNVGINVSSSILLETPRKAGGYGFGPKSLGFVYFTPIVGIILGELFGHFFNDFIAAKYVSRHHGLFVPEARLWTNYIGAFFMIPGLVLVGQTLHRHLPWVGLVFGWGMTQFGIMIISVAIVTYVIDCYPSASGEVSALINFGRVSAGFSVGYFQQAWGKKQGFDVSFGLQSVVVACALVLLIVIQHFGGRLRKWAGPVTPL